MKVITLILCLLELQGISTADDSVKDYLPKNYIIDDAKTLERQLEVLKLFKSKDQHPEAFMGSVFILKDFLDLFSDKQLAKEILQFEHLQNSDIFSVYNPDHLEQAIRLFKLFYSAKDIDSFFKAAHWARKNIENDQLFQYSLSVALVHRPDTFGLILPPIYEVNPYYFFRSELIDKAQQLKQQDSYEPIEDLGLIHANLDRERVLSYFTEDVDLNSFNYYYHIFYPWWMGKEYGLMEDKRGDIFYFVLSQLVARYDAERLSNSLEEVGAIDFDSPLEVGYYPGMKYQNGVQFPSRPAGVSFKDGARYSENGNFSNSYKRLKDITNRIQNVVDLGSAFGIEIYKNPNDGLETLSNLLEGNPDSPNLPYYGTLQLYARQLLGYAPQPFDPKKPIPSSTQHDETTLRDPASWKFFKWLLGFYNDFYDHIPPYTTQELENEGVTIYSVDVHEFITYFEPFTYDLGQAVFYAPEDADFDAELTQNRLNHKPIVYNITINSDQKRAGIVKVFLGPKTDRYGQTVDLRNREKFYVFDYFPCELKQGTNVITRNIDEGGASGDRTSYKGLFRFVEGALNGEETFIVDGSEAYWAFPNRLIIPKGTTGGMSYQLYVIVIPTEAPVDQANMYKRVGTGSYTGNLTLRFPLDRKIADPSGFNLKNTFLADVVIRHT